MIDDPQQPVLVIFCRRPRLGYGKQRLAESVGQRIALEVANQLLTAALEDARDWPGRVVLAPADPEDAGWARALLPNAEVMAQPAGGLGRRISQIDTRVRATGAESVLFIGTDAPGMRATNLLDAIAALKEHNAVFIPAADGGVTLLGANKSWPKLDDLAWETPQLFPELLKRCESVGWHCCQLETGYDVDTLSDLLLARDELAKDERPARRHLCEWLDAAKLDMLPPRQAETDARSVTVIVPVYHDSDALEKLLGTLRSFADGPDEIIVVDGTPFGADADVNAGISELHQARHYKTQACRGVQMHLGATLARSATLWFLHADAGPAPESLDLIRTRIDSGQPGGYFRFSFAGRDSVFRRLLASAINLRARFGTPYGDQGLFFSGDAYFDAGGFAPEPLFEEVSLVRRLRRRDKFLPVAAAIKVSTRRWDRDGWLQRTIRNRMLVIRYMLGTPPAELMRVYRSELQTTAHD